MPTKSHLRWAALASPWLVLGAFLICRGEDLDTWFHLAAGRWIIEHAQAPALDPFSFTASARAYLDSHWLFQVVLYGTYALGGFPLMTALQAACFLAAVSLALRSVEAPAPEALAAGLLLMALVVKDRILLRPDMMTFLFLGIYWRALYSQKPARRAWLWSLPLVQALWVNMHGLFLFGPVLAGCAALGASAARWLPLPRGLQEAEKRGVSWIELWGLTLAVSAACLLTPYGLESLRYALLLYRETGSDANSFMKGVSELKSHSLVSPWSPTLVCHRLIVLLSAASLLLNLKGLRLSALGVYGAFLFLAQMTIRNTAYFAFLAVPWALQNLGPGPEKTWPRLRPLLQGAAILTALLLAGAVASDRFYLLTDDIKRFGVGPNPFLSVGGAARFVESEGIAGRGFNDILLGGNLIWRWHPKRAVFIDGRLEVYGPELLGEYKRLSEAPEAFWDKAVEKWGLEFAVLTGLSPYSERLIPYLSARKDWLLAYCDGYAGVYLRQDGINRAAAKRLSRRKRGILDPLPEETRRPTEAGYPIRELARAKFALLAGDPRAAREEYEKALQAAPDSLDVHYNLGVLLAKTGQTREAMRRLEAVLKRSSRHPGALANLGGLTLSEGGAAEAAALLERSAKLKPDEPGTYGLLGTAYYLLQDYEKAAASYQRSLDLFPDDAFAHHNLGACYLKLDRRQEAIGQFRAALRLRPGYPEARQALASLGEGDTPPAKK